MRFTFQFRTRYLLSGKVTVTAANNRSHFVPLCTTDESTFDWTWQLKTTPCLYSLYSLVLSTPLSSYHFWRPQCDASEVYSAWMTLQ